MNVATGLRPSWTKLRLEKIAWAEPRTDSTPRLLKWLKKWPMARTNPRMSVMDSSKPRGRCQMRQCQPKRCCWKRVREVQLKPEFPNGELESTTSAPQTDLEQTREGAIQTRWKKTSTRTGGSIRRLRRGKRMMRWCQDHPKTSQKPN